MFRLARFAGAWLAWFWLGNVCTAVTLSDPAVDAYNVRLGTATIGGLYQFTTNTMLVESAQAIGDLGEDTVKMYLGPEYPHLYHMQLPSSVTNLVGLARDYPSCRQVFAMPFRHYVMWTYTYSAGATWWKTGPSPEMEQREYKELYAFASYLLTNYNNSGKDFYLGHWEGDWYLLPNYNTATNPSPATIRGMIAWLNVRQKAVDDAMAQVSHTNVAVYGYTEVNRVRDAMTGPASANQRLVNSVLPFVTNIDFVSWSSYDGQGLNVSNLYATLDYLQSQLPTNKAAAIPGARVFVGEYGWGAKSTTEQEPLTRAYIQRLLKWQSPVGGLPFVLFWEMYNNEPGRNFCLVDSNNVKTASWFLQQRFINRARLLTAQFKETHRRLPDDAEFSALTAPVLDQPLPAPVALTVSNLTTTPDQNLTATVSSVLTQDVYGDDCATIRVFWGLRDAGEVTNEWSHNAVVGLNTNFNPAVFTFALSNLVANTHYYFRFHASNQNASAWTPVSGQFTTAGAGH